MLLQCTEKNSRSIVWFNQDQANNIHALSRREVSTISDYRLESITQSTVVGDTMCPIRDSTEVGRKLEKFQLDLLELEQNYQRNIQEVRQSTRASDHSHLSKLQRHGSVSSNGGNNTKHLSISDKDEMRTKKMDGA